MNTRTEVINAVARIVEDACKQDSNIFGYSIWSHHIRSVVRYGRRLARELNADPEIIELAALLHDYAGIKDEDLYKEHHVHSAAEAERILSGLGYPQEKIEAVTYCILTHRGSRAMEKQTPEAICLASADAMAHISQVPSLLHLAFVQRNMEVEEGVKWVRGKLKRSWKKLSPEARAIIRDRYDAALMVLAEMK